jgi:hypothetical protein
MCFLFNFVILKKSDLLWYPRTSTVDIQVYEHIVIEQIFGLNVELDIQVNVQCAIA